MTYSESNPYSGISVVDTFESCSEVVAGGQWRCTGVHSVSVNGVPSEHSTVVAYTSPETSYTCGENAQQVGGSGASMQCACPTRYMAKSNGVDCYQYTCPPSGGYSAITQPDQLVQNAGDSLCTGGCGYQPSSWKVGQDGKIWATWPFKSTGSFCGGAPSPTNPAIDTGELNSKNPAPVACGANQCPGTVNGTTMCVPCQKQTEQGPSTSASAPAGSASGPGSTTTTTQTECNGVTCTTTKTTTDPATGAVVGSTSTTQKQESFCQENPTSTICKQSMFGGSCGAITCDGDAIQCAIAADQYKRNCQWFDDPAGPAMQAKGQGVMTDLSQPADHPYTTATSTSVSFSSAIDTTDRLGGACPVDQSVAFMGKTLTLPFSQLCGPLSWLGNLLVGLTMLACAFIVFKS